MSNEVALENSVEIETSTAKLAQDTKGTGAWAMTNVLPTLGDTLSVQGKNVVLKVEVEWIYKGGSNDTGPVAPMTDSAVLIPVETKLKDRHRNVLVKGDEVVGTVDSGNKIVIKKTQEILTTA